MLHKFFEPGMWFRPKSFGFGSGLPIAWQGWVLLAVHVALIIGLALAFKDRPALLVPLAIFVSIAPFPIYSARTEGGWKWRWGGK